MYNNDTKMKKKNKDSRIYEKQRTSGAQDSSQSGSHEIESPRGTVYLFAVSRILYST